MHRIKGLGDKPRSTLTAFQFLQWTANKLSDTAWTLSTSGVYLGLQGSEYDGVPVVGVTESEALTVNIWRYSANGFDVTSDTLT